MLEPELCLKNIYFRQTGFKIFIFLFYLIGLFLFSAFRSLPVPRRHTSCFGQPDYRIFELNKRLQQRTEVNSVCQHLSILVTYCLMPFSSAFQLIFKQATVILKISTDSL